jgi:hypothetical protein
MRLRGRPDNQDNQKARRVSEVAVGVTAVVDAYYDDLVSFLMDAVQDAVSAAACRVDAGEVATQRFADTSGAVDEGTGEELDDRCCDSLRQRVLNGADRRRGED